MQNRSSITISKRLSQNIEGYNYIDIIDVKNNDNLIKKSISFSKNDDYLYNNHNGESKINLGGCKSYFGPDYPINTQEYTNNNNLNNPFNKNQSYNLNIDEKNSTN